MARWVNPSITVHLDAEAAVGQQVWIERRPGERTEHTIVKLHPDGRLDLDPATYPDGEPVVAQVVVE